MEYTSNIKSIFKKESFNTKDGALMHKYVVEFVNGHNPNVFTTKDLDYNVGDEVTYNLDQAKNKAKLMPKNINTYSNPKDDIQKYIIRQSCLDRATELLKDRNYNWEVETNRKKLTDLAEYLKNYVYNG
jgi:hypothetical protein|tara:strand:+ start:1665 stop:2051 length:387 start_codon:yes stop_codon:yes gene_type:complete